MRVWFFCAFLLFLFGLSCFAPWVISGKYLAPLDIQHEMLLPWRGESMAPNVHNHFVVDAVAHYIPYRTLAQQAFKEDGYIGWNPLLFGGTPQNANTMLISYDWSVLLHRFLPFWDAWTFGRLGQILLAGLGMLLFLGSRGYGSGVATLGAVAFMLNQQFVAWIYFNQVVASFCWMPFLLWAIYQSIEKSRCYLAVGAVFLALALLGATLQQAAFVLAALLCIYFGLLIDNRSSAETRRVTAYFLIFGLLGSAVTSFMLEPTIQAYFDNERTGHGRGGFHYEAGPLQPLLHLFASPLTAFPSLFGSVSSLDLWKVFKFDTYYVGFFGTIPMVLACLAFFSPRVPSSAKLLMLAGILIPLSPIVGFVYHRFNVLWILGGCWACCAWLASCSNMQRKQISRWMMYVLFSAVLVWLVGSILLTHYHELIDSWLQSRVSAASPSSAFGIFHEWMRERASGLLGYLCVWNPWQLLMAAGAALSIWGLANLDSRRVIQRFLSALGVALQLSVFWWQWTTWSEPSSRHDKPQLASFLQQEVGETGRLATEVAGWPDTMFPPNMLMPFGVAISGGYDAIHPFGMKSPSGKSWDFPGTTHFLGIVGQDGPEGWEQIWSDGRWHVLRNPEQVIGVVASSAGKMPLSRDRFFRPTLNTMEVLAPTGATSLTLYSNWHRGWRWRDPFNNSWSPTKQSEIRSVQVKFNKPLPSDSLIAFRYVPSPPKWTIVLTLVSLLGIAAVAVYGRRRTG